MGEVFAGRYELVDVLDAGGVGTVWRAWDHRESRYLAAKVLRQSDGDSLLRFVRETSHRISHPHVVTPLGWAGEDERVLFTMPLVRGGSLATLLGDFGALPLPWVRDLLAQLLEALEAVHGAGLVHRDVKPANLLLEVTGAGRPRLLLSDFGAAARISAPRLTHADSVIGTPGYFAPEQLRGADPDPRQDIYASAVVALQMLTGRAPSVAGDLPVLGVDHPADPALTSLLAEMTDPDPARRPPSARACLTRLGETTGGHPALGHDVEVFDHVPDLPEGWTGSGPAGAVPDRTPPQPAGSVSVPGSGSATRTLAREGGPEQGQEPPTARPAIPATAWALAVLGVALLVVAVLLER